VRAAPTGISPLWITPGCRLRREGMRYLVKEDGAAIGLAKTNFIFDRSVKEPLNVRTTQIQQGSANAAILDYKVCAAVA
jgi:hypothetical protein